MSFLRLAALGLLLSSFAAAGCTTPNRHFDSGRADTGEDPEADGGSLDAPAPDDAAALDAPPGDAAGLGASCGRVGPCAAGLDCIHTIEDACGVSDAPGTCQERPTMCSRLLAPVCGCDGATYDNECEAHRAGVSAARNGACGADCSGEVTCDAIAPRCVIGNVAEVVEGCWGGCVDVAECECDDNADCVSGSTGCDLTTHRCLPAD